MSENNNNNNNNNCESCKPSVLIGELSKRVDKIEDVQSRIFDKIDAVKSETSDEISQLKESQAEMKTYYKLTLENINDIKGMIKNNSDSNLELVMKVVQANSDTIIKNNKINLESTKITQEIQAEQEISKNNGTVEITKGKLALLIGIITFLGTALPYIAKIIFHI